MPEHRANCTCWQCVNAHAITPSGGSLEKKIEGGQGGALQPSSARVGIAQNQSPRVSPLACASDGTALISGK